MKFLAKVLHNLCYPDPEIYKTELERELISKKNKAILTIESIVLLILALYIYITNGPNFIQKISFILILLEIIVLLFTCRSHRGIFIIFYTLLVLLYGPVLLYFNDDSIFFSWISAQVFPLFILYLSDKRRLFLIQGFVQLLYLHFIYKEKLADMILMMDVSAFVKRMTNIASYALVMNLVFVSGVESDTKAMYQKITEINNLRIEKQKIFLLSFSHELRNLLNSIVGNIRVSQMEEIQSTIKGYLDNAILCGEVLIHLVNNILDTGKLEVGDLEITLMNVPIYETLKNIWNICSELIKKKGLKGTFTICNRIPKNVIIDHYRLTQIVLNLIGNAVKFTEKGSVDISIEWLEDQTEVNSKCFEPIPFDEECVYDRHQSFIRIAPDYFQVNTETSHFNPEFKGAKITQKQKGVLKISINDTGCGVSEDDLPKLFQQYAQIGDNSQRKLGTGLGLFITKYLCQKLHGEVKAYSQLGKGTSCIVCLPIEAVPEEQVQSATVTYLEENKAISGMIVDDVEFNVDILRKYMERLNIPIKTTAKNGLEAVQKYMDSVQNNQPIKLLTMDIQMPVMDGKDAARQIRKFEKEKGIQPCMLLMISGNCNETEINECLDMNGDIQAQAFLKKPVKMEDIKKVILPSSSKRISKSFG